MVAFFDPNVIVFAMQKFIFDWQIVKLFKIAFKRIIFFCALPLLVVGCASTGTKSDGIPKSSKKELPSYSPREGKFWVYRLDGSKSCGVKKGMPLSKAVSELDKRGVRVLKRRKSHDGKMRMMVCGADTGMQIELRIDGQSLPIAGALGYRVLGED